ACCSEDGFAGSASGGMSGGGTGLLSGGGSSIGSGECSARAGSFCPGGFGSGFDGCSITPNQVATFLPLPDERRVARVNYQRFPGVKREGQGNDEGAIMRIATALAAATVGAVVFSLGLTVQASRAAEQRGASAPTSPPPTSDRQAEFGRFPD